MLHHPHANQERAIISPRPDVESLQADVVRLRQQVRELKREQIDAMALLQSLPLTYGAATGLVDQVRVVVKAWSRREHPS